MGPPPSTLILPVESQVRELDAKILLACAAAERGFPVVLGSRAFVHYAVASLPRGVYLAKSMRRASDRMFGILRDLGHEIVAWDEEGLVRCPDPQYWESRLSARAVAATSMLFAWGPDHERALRAYPELGDVPVVVTGNPRLDLPRPELRGYFAEHVASIRGRFGDFVLMNTNFGRLNHFFPRLSEMRRDLERERAEDFDAVRARHRHALLGEFAAAVPAIADEFPDQHLVIRPHPSEGHGFWRDAAGGRPNVTVLNEGSVVPWLMAARALVHNGCTTSVEAFRLGTPAVAYRPVVCESFDDPLPTLVSHEAFDREALLKLLRGALTGEIGPVRDPGRLAGIRVHLGDPGGPLCADRMVDALVERGYLAGPPPPTPLHRRGRGWAHCHARTAVKRVRMHWPGHRNHVDYHRHRFPGIGVGELQARIDRLGRLLGRFRGVRAATRSEHVFWIRSQRA